MAFLSEQLLFYFSIGIVLFMPGWFLVQFISNRKYSRTSKEPLFSSIEIFVISFGLSIVFIDFLMILMGKFGILLTRNNILFILMLLFAIFLFWKKTKYFKKSTKYKSTETINASTITIILILLLTILIKTAYLRNTIFPTSTDLGHHMYWSKQISETGKLPVYEKIKIVTDNNAYKLTSPQPISDFIIGEHLIFSAINMISGIPFVSYFPTLILFLINMMSILALFILTLRLFPKNNKVAIITLLLIGPLWALSSPQAKFVSGGVIGNLLGNLFIPLCLYFYYRAFNEKKSVFLTLALFLTMGMFYTHHLSGLIFLFVVAFTLLFLFLFFIKEIIINKKNVLSFEIVNNYFKLFFSKSNIFFLIFAISFLLFVYTPAYLINDATKTVVGTPSKSTRAGLSFTQFKYAVGEPRLALGVLGLFIISFLSVFKKNKNDFLKYSILFGWATSLTLMTIKPGWLHINLPSGRIANYVNFPFIIIGSFAFVWLVRFFKKNKYSYLSPKVVSLFYLSIFTFIFSAGFYDNSQTLKSKSNNQKALETFLSSKYLNQHLDEKKHIVIKDHNYLKADGWIKLFFMKDYNIPLSRSYFKRYNDPTKQREKCTLWMISEPNSDRGKKCYNDIGVSFAIINQKIDDSQFKKSKMWKIFSGDNIAIYYNK